MTHEHFTRVSTRKNLVVTLVGYEGSVAGKTWPGIKQGSSLYLQDIGVEVPRDW